MLRHARNWIREAGACRDAILALKARCWNWRERDGPATWLAGAAWLMLGGFALGLVAGLFVNLAVGADRRGCVADHACHRPAGQIFLRLLFMLVIRCCSRRWWWALRKWGICGRWAALARRLLLMTVLMSGVAVPSASPWSILPAGRRSRARHCRAAAGAGRRRCGEHRPERAEIGGAGPVLLDLIPANFFAAAAGNQILQVMVFALFFGIGLVMAKSPATDRLQQVIEGVFEVTMKLINLVIRVAPIAIACLMFNLAALFGWDLLVRLAAFVGVAVGAMAIHAFVVYPLIVWSLGRTSPLAFFRGIREPMLVAFSTASSNATLPVSLRAAETALKLPRRMRASC